MLPMGDNGAFCNHTG